MCFRRDGLPEFYRRVAANIIRGEETTTDAPFVEGEKGELMSRVMRRAEGPIVRSPG